MIFHSTTKISIRAEKERHFMRLGCLLQYRRTTFTIYSKSGHKRVLRISFDQLNVATFKNYLRASLEESLSLLIENKLKIRKKNLSHFFAIIYVVKKRSF